MKSKIDISEAKKVLVRHWGYTQFRPGQEEVITSVLASQDTLALLPTGGGKSICYQLPALMFEGVSLVITPLIALMNDQVNNLKKRGLKAAAIHTALHSSEAARVYAEAAFGELKLLYISPERIHSHGFIENLRQLKVSLIVVDEAHCISQWGYDFRPSYLRIAELRALLPGVPVLAVTATATNQVSDDIQEKLLFQKKNLIKTSFARKNLAYHVIKEPNQISYLQTLIRQAKGSSIVYVRNRRKSKEIADLLMQQGISATYYHAGLEAKTRNNRQRSWTSGEVLTIVATNAFGMGIDKANVRLVVHFDLPENIEAYFQEAGRAGRDEQPAQAVILYTEQGIELLKKQFNQRFPKIEEIRALYEKLAHYLNIPLEGGKNKQYAFNLYKFASKIDKKPLEVYHILELLQKEGYLMYLDQPEEYSKLFFLLKKQDLYKYQVSNARHDEFLKVLLRTYEGVFTDYIRIDEAKLAHLTGKSISQIQEIMHELHLNQVIHYIPVQKDPALLWLSERVRSGDLYLSPAHYDTRKKQAALRLQSMINYMTEKAICRSQLLLNYFGENASTRCGICDVCSAINRLEMDDLKIKQLKGEIIKKLQLKNYHLYELAADLKDYEEDGVLRMIDWLLDHELIERLEDESLHLKTQTSLNI